MIAAYDLLLRDERFAEPRRPRPRPALRRDADQQAAAGLARGVAAPTRSSSTRAAAGTSRPAARRRCCGPTRPSSPRAGRRGSGARPRARRAWLEAERRRAARRSRPSSAATTADHRAGAAPGARRAPTATATSSTPPRACRSATRRRSCRRRRPTSSSSATAAPTGSTACSPPGSAPPHASGRPTTIVTGDLGLLHDLGGLAALREVRRPVRIVVIDNDGGGIFHFLPQAEALDGEEFEALLGTPRGVDAAKAADLFGLPHRRLESLDELPDALAAGTGLIEVRRRPPRERRAAPAPADASRRGRRSAIAARTSGFSRRCGRPRGRGPAARRRRRAPPRSATDLRRAGAVGVHLTTRRRCRCLPPPLSTARPGDASRCPRGPSWPDPPPESGQPPSPLAVGPQRQRGRSSSVRRSPASCRVPARRAGGRRSRSVRRVDRLARCAR